MTSAAGFGLATIAGDGTVLDAWFPDPELGAYSPSGTTRLSADDAPDNLAALSGPDPDRGVEVVPIRTVTVLADKFEGKPLNAPNDGAVHSDGSIWFTDPGYGSMMDYEGNKGELLLKEAVYRIDSSGEITKITEDLEKPNGLCFSPDYKKVYIVDTGAPKNIRVYEVDGKKVKNGKVLVTNKGMLSDKAAKGNSDGIRCDIEGNLWASAGWIGDGFDGVHVFNPEGKMLGHIKLPETVSNLCFGGPKRNRLFMTASQSLYSLYVNTRGAHHC